MPAPSKLAHVVLQTNQLPVLRDWYCTVLSARPAFENEQFAFLAYDDEHHRIGIVSLDEYERPEKPAVGLHHLSFTYDTLRALFDTYSWLKREKITPVWTVNHGPTVSMYYADPDSNAVELQVDVFATAEEVDRFMKSEVYRKNPRGVDFDPEEMLAQLNAGASFESLTRRDR